MSADFVAVSRERFFAVLGPRDIVLKSEPERTIWETRDRVTVGISTPGWRNSGTVKTWKLRADYAGGAS